MVPYRETIVRSSVGERKYVRYFDGRGRFAHLRVELLPRPGELPSVTAADGLELPADCYHAVRAALFKKIDRGPIRGFPMIGLQVRLLAATYLPAYSYPEAFAAAASMALDEAMIHASPIITHRALGWSAASGRRSCALRNSRYAHKVAGPREGRDISWRAFSPRDGSPGQAQPKSGFGSRFSSSGHLSLPEAKRYRPLSGPLDQETSQDVLEDWT